MVLTACGTPSSSGSISVSSSSSVTSSSSSSSGSSSTSSSEQSSSSSSSDNASSSTSEEPIEEKKLLTIKEHVLLTNVDQLNLFEDYEYLVEGLKVPLSDFTFSASPNNIELTSTTFTLLNKGIFPFTITDGTTDFPLIIVTKLITESDYIVYDEPIVGRPNGAIPSDFLIKGNGATGIASNRLFVDSTGGASNTLVLFPSYLQQFGNYIIEAQMRVESFNERTRWHSLIYRYTPEDEYFQMAMRQGATATNGVEFAKWINNGWDVPKTVAYKNDLVQAQYYNIKVDVLGSIAKEYIDNELLITYEQADDFTKGRIGVQTSGMKSGFRNIRVTIPESYVTMEKTTYSTLPDIYQKNTGIINTPTVAQVITNQAMHTSVLGSVRPQVAIYGVKLSGETLQLTDASGVVLGNASDLIPLVNTKVILAFKPDSRATNVALANYLKDIALLDMYVMAAEAIYIQEARSIFSRIRGILEIPYNTSKPTLSYSELTTLKNNINASQAVVGVLPPQYVNRQTVEFLSKRLVTIWAFDQSLIATQEAIASGVYGLISQDFQNLYQLFDTFPSSFQIRRPFIIGHRGIPSQAPENSLGGLKRAVELGADIIEYDVFITADEHIVVMHDSTIDRTTSGTGEVETMTLAQLRQPSITLNDATGNYPNEMIPTLAEVFDEFKDQDVIHFIEIKSGKENIVPVLRTLIVEKNIFDNALVISFNESQINRVRTQIPEISTGFLNSSIAVNEDTPKSVRAAINKLAPMRATFNPYFGPLSPSLVQQLIYRGITTWPWTLNVQSNYFAMNTMGVAGITTDYTQYPMNEKTRLEAKELTVTINRTSFSPQPLKGILSTQLGTTLEINLELLLIDAGGTGLTMINDQLSSASQAGTAYVRGQYSVTFDSGQSYYLTTSLIQVVVEFGNFMVLNHDSK
jgi:glycerophosphoryl diester phosphodiesterase